MAVVGVGGWIGSSAKAETGNDWMSGAMRTLGVPVPGWMSQLAGKSKEVHYSIGANHSYNKDTLINYLRSLGSTAVVVTITGDLVSYSSGVPCLEFPSNLPNSYITLIINPGVTVYGRGGNGGSNSPGGAGGSSSHMSSGAAAGTISAPGKGSVGEGSLSAYTGGSGGNVGAAGGRCNTHGNGTEYNGGAAGKAVTGNAPRWDAVGAIYGSRV